VVPSSWLLEAVDRDVDAPPPRRRPVMHHVPKPLAALAAAALLILATSFAGCSAVEKSTSISDLPAEARVPAVEYVIQPGDELELIFRHTPELNVLVQVRPDGGFSAPIVHAVLAAGKTVEELRSELTVSYATELYEPDVAVIVRNFAGHQVHVGGEVGEPGVYPMVRPTTALEAVFAAGGLLPSARLSEVLVIRKSEASYIVVPLALDDAIDGSDPKQNLVLLPYDIIFVPRSTIANVNLWVDQYVRQNIPVNFTIRLGDFTD